MVNVIEGNTGTARRLKNLKTFTVAAKNISLYRGLHISPTSEIFMDHTIHNNTHIPNITWTVRSIHNQHTRECRPYGAQHTKNMHRTVHVWLNIR